MPLLQPITPVSRETKMHRKIYGIKCVKMKIITKKEMMMGIEKVGQIGVPVQDLERAAAFYQDVLGLSLLFQTDRMAFFECGEVRLLLSLPEKTNLLMQAPSFIFKLKICRLYMMKLQQKASLFQ